ncbi:hypothetical protein Hanom_Chr17g01531031 [Helianthus anomalus]
MIPVDTLIEERLTEEPINDASMYFVEIHFGGVKMMLFARTLLNHSL